MTIDQRSPGPGSAPTSASAAWQKLVAMPLIVLAIAARRSMIEHREIEIADITTR